MPDPQRILLVGDLHMNTLAAHQVIDHAQALAADLILQPGDFGFWPRASDGQRYLDEVEVKLPTFGLDLLGQGARVGRRTTHEPALLVDAEGTPVLDLD